MNRKLLRNNHTCDRNLLGNNHTCVTLEIIKLTNEENVIENIRISLLQCLIQHNNHNHNCK